MVGLTFYYIIILTVAMSMGPSTKAYNLRGDLYATVKHCVCLQTYCEKMHTLYYWPKIHEGTGVLFVAYM